MTFSRRKVMHERRHQHVVCMPRQMVTVDGVDK